MIVRVCKKSAKNFWVFINGEIVQVKSRGKVKQEINIKVGDLVDVENIDSELIINRVLERKNFIIRPSISNIDIMIIVQSVKEPNFSTHLLNSYLSFYERNNINRIAIFLSKKDLLNDIEKKELTKIIYDYKKDNYEFYSYEKKSYSNFLRLFNNNIICLAGQSGVGKSTLINKMLPDLKIVTQKISHSLNRGKHTTTTTTLLHYKNNSFIADTPGFSLIEKCLRKKDYAKSFALYRELGQYCKFNDCLHINEKGCNIIKKFNLNEISKLKYLDYKNTIEKIKN